MLVLSRKVLEEIVIGDDIVISVVQIRGDKVRLGIEAPKHVTVHRREVYEDIQAQKRAAGPEANRVRPEGKTSSGTPPGTRPTRPGKRRKRRLGPDAGSDSDC